MDNLTQAQRDAIRRAEIAVAREPQRARSMAQGLTLGFADEIEAFVRSALPDSPEYSQIRDELRTKLRTYKEDNPNAALTYELAGALVPSAALALTGVGVPAAEANIARIIGRGALEGGLYGYGASEAPSSAMAETTTGVATGAVMAPAVQLGLRAGKGLFSKLIDTVREKVGEKPATAVQAEIQRLQEQTGKSTEEILLDLSEGRLMSDNKTLMAALKNIVSEGGESGRAVLQQTQQRAGETRQAAMEGLQRQLSPETDPNVLRGVRQSEEALRQAERESYGRVFSGAPEVTPEVADEMLRVAKSSQDLAQDMMQRYQAEGRLVPPFKIAENGELQMVRIPSLEDAEIMRRVIDDKANALFRSGRGDMGSIYAGISSRLRGQIDEMSPELRGVRQTAAQTRTGKEAFEAGRKALSMNVDELEMVIEAMTPEAQKLFRSGLMDAIRNKVRRQGTTLANLADEDKQFGQVLRTVLGDQDITQLSRQLQLAGETAEIAQKMPPTAGSPTAPLMQERARAGMRGSMQDIARIGAGDPTIIVDLIDRFLRRDRPQLTDQQRMQVVNVLFSRDPETVRKALTNEAALNQLVEMSGRIADTLISGATSGGIQQATQTTTGLLPAIEGQR